MTHEISWDGRLWMTVSSAQNPALTTAAYVGVEAGGAAAYFDFLRFEKL